MPATAPTQLIFFIASILISGLLAGTFMSVAFNYIDTMEKRSTAQKKEMETEIEIINDPANMPYNASAQTLILYVKNTGSREIALSSIVVICNGTYQTDLTITLLLGYTRWLKGGVAQIQINNIVLQPGDYKAKVIVEQGVYASIEFRI